VRRAEGAAAGTPLRNGTNGTHAETPDAPPAYSSNRSPSPETFTPQPRPSAPSKQSHASSSDDHEAASSTLTDKIAAASPLSYEEIQSKLAEAQATIASYASEGGLRMRKVAAGETSSKTVNDVAHAVQQGGAQGVPLQIVAALCLVSFLLAYLFF